MLVQYLHLVKIVQQWIHFGKKKIEFSWRGWSRTACCYNRFSFCTNGKKLLQLLLIHNETHELWIVKKIIFDELKIGQFLKIFWMKVIKGDNYIISVKLIFKSDLFFKFFQYINNTYCFQIFVHLYTIYLHKENIFLH